MIKDLLETIDFEALPAAWTTFDFNAFSLKKRLWDFQVQAVQNALKMLWQFYHTVPLSPGDEVNFQRKNNLLHWLQDNGLTENLDILLPKNRLKLRRILEEYFPVHNNRIPFVHYLNRMGFWMATGSGKTVVIVKLMQILFELMERGVVLEFPVLFLTHREDLILQFKKLVDEANEISPIPLTLKELKEFGKVQYGFQAPRNRRIVYYYRSDNIADVQKERLVDFRNYENDGRWFLFLDEAHKGDKEESKRQHFYAILARNGFLFNFSATFVDARDRFTTVFEFNLASFIRAGYGKHLKVLRQQFDAFSSNTVEKQKIVLKALLLFTYVKKFFTKLPQPAYHRPLLLALVNSVNVPQADLQLLFRELERIARGEVEEVLVKQAKQELAQEFLQDPGFLFEPEQNSVFDHDLFNALQLNDLLQMVFNASRLGEIEVSYRPSDPKQVAFKLTTADAHFALSKTGDMPHWLKEELHRFKINHQFEDEGFFERINADDSSINLLMGSRSFYEGWDSNRPNVLIFINIGKGQEARKFVLQSVGRGVRIEPFAHLRNRLQYLHSRRQIDSQTFEQLAPLAEPLETLFIFATNYAAVKTVLSELKAQQPGRTVSEKTIRPYIPVYYWQGRPLNLQQNKLRLSRKDFEQLQKFVNFIKDDRILLVLTGTQPAILKIFKQALKEPAPYFDLNHQPQVGNPEIVLKQVLTFLELHAVRQQLPAQELEVRFKQIAGQFTKEPPLFAGPLGKFFWRPATSTGKIDLSSTARQFLNELQAVAPGLALWDWWAFSASAFLPPLLPAEKDQVELIFWFKKKDENFIVLVDTQKSKQKLQLFLSLFTEPDGTLRTFFTARNERVKMFLLFDDDVAKLVFKFKELVEHPGRLMSNEPLEKNVK